MSAPLPEWPTWTPTREDDDALAYRTQQFYAARARLREAEQYLQITLEIAEQSGLDVPMLRELLLNLLPPGEGR